MSQNKEQINKNELYYVLGTHTVSFTDPDEQPYTIKFIHCTNIFGQETYLKFYTIKVHDWEAKSIKNAAAFVERGDEIIVRNGEFIGNLTQKRLKEQFIAKHVQFVR